MRLRKILVVDDRPATLEMARAALGSDYDAFLTDDYSNIVADIEKYSPDVLVIGLTYKNVSDVLAELIAHNVHDHMLIFGVLPASIEVRNQIAAAELADIYISMPCDPVELRYFLRKTEEWVSTRNSPEQDR